MNINSTELALRIENDLQVGPMKAKELAKYFISLMEDCTSENRTEILEEVFDEISYEVTEAIDNLRTRLIEG